jgi:hypothetical protein
MGFETDSKRGVQVHYGVREINGKFGGVLGTKDGLRTAEWVFDYDDLPAGGTGAIQCVIPAYAKIMDCYLEVLTAFTGSGGVFDIGLEQADGTEIDDNGLFSGLALASIDARGDIVKANGALAPSLVSTTVGEAVVPTAVDIGAAAGELKVAGSDTDLLTGAGRVVVEYIVDR